MTNEKIISEARAKMIWGESPEGVLAFLQTEGFDAQQSAALIELFSQERKKTIQACGRKKLLIGSGLMLVPVVTYFVFQSLGLISLKILGAAIAVGVFGLWKVLKGVLDLIFPESEKGDLSSYE